MHEYQAEAVVGRGVAKTTIEEIVYHKGHALKVFTAMKDTMEAERWAPNFRVCCHPPNTMPSDSRLHGILVALLGVQVHVDAPLHAGLWAIHQRVSVDHFHVTWLHAPTTVW